MNHKKTAPTNGAGYAAIIEACPVIGMPPTGIPPAGIPTN